MTTKHPKHPQPVSEPTAFLKEVDDFLHQEKMAKLWKKYKLAVYVSVAGLFIAVGGITYYTQQKEASLAVQAESWWKIAQSETPEQAKSAINEIIKDSAFGYRMLGDIELTKAALAQDDFKTALSKIRALKNDPDADTLHKDIATFFEGQILMTTNPEQAKTIFTSLDNSNSPFQLSALEMLAMLAENNNSKVEAIALYERIVESKEINPAMRNRAEMRIKAIKATQKK